jgi:hypothetical protein
MESLVRFHRGLGICDLGAAADNLEIDACLYACMLLSFLFDNIAASMISDLFRNC